MQIWEQKQRKQIKSATFSSTSLFLKFSSSAPPAPFLLPSNYTSVHHLQLSNRMQLVLHSFWAAHAPETRWRFSDYFLTRKLSIHYFYRNHVQAIDCMYLMTHFPATGPYLLFSCPTASLAPFPSIISNFPTAETPPNPIEIGKHTFVIRVISIFEILFVYCSEIICCTALFLFYLYLQVSH